MWRIFLFVLTFFSIPVIACRAEIEIGVVGIVRFRVPCVAESGVSNGLGCVVGKASLNYDCNITGNRFFGDEALIEDKMFGIRSSANCARAGVNYLPPVCVWQQKTSLSAVSKSFVKKARGKTRIGDRIRWPIDCAIIKVPCGLSSQILILDGDREVVPYTWLSFHLGANTTNPSSAGCLHFLELSVDSLCLLRDRVVNLNHFNDLPSNSDQSHGNQSNRKPLAKFTSIILGAFLIAVGLAFCFYGVYQRREIGGSADAIILGGCALFVLASYFIIAAIDVSLPLPFGG